MSKLDTINKSITEIREILGEECASIEQLPDLVRNIAYDPTRSGFTTAFVFSLESHPNTPTGGSLDTATGLVIGLEEGWSQQINSKVSAIWMSFAIFNPSGERITEWSIPVNLKGEKGERGVPGEIGAMGPAGPQGEKGDSANSYRTVSVYTTTETIDAPAKPIGGKWNLETNEITPPTTEIGVKWFLNADEPAKNNYLWMSQATFAEDGRLVNNWCSPFRLTGENGKNGVDGYRSEFIYRILPNITSYENLKEFTKDLYSPEYEDNYVPVVNDDLNIGTVWSNHPSGISEGFPIEVCCNRTRKSSEESWSGWSSCIIWAKWGEDGIDGDGVEYIYRVTPKKIDDQDITSKYVEDYFMPNLYEAVDFEGYQEDGYYFVDYGWTDEPTDVSPDNPVEWVSIRKKINGVWGRFTSPKVWATFSEDGAAYITSFVFKRGSDVNDVLTGGSFENPRPDQYDWSDSIPTDSDLPVWMSCRTFKSNDNTYGSWTSPKMLSDTPDFQVEYTANIERPNPNLYPFDGDINKWRAEQFKAGCEWGDDSQIPDPKWMATTSRKNGKWSEWILTMIKGEKGEKGDAGSSVTIEGHFDSESELFTAWDNYVKYGDISGFYFESEDGIINQGDGWYTKDSGLLYTYSGGWDGDIEKSEFDDYWFSTPIKGEPGNSTRLYIKYTDTNVEGATLYDTPKKYIGIKVSDIELDPKTLNTYSTYTWSKFRGDDGFGQEQVFLLTDNTYDPSVGNNPPIPTDNKSIAGYLPLHGLGEHAKGTDDGRWVDSPLSVSKDFPYCWVVSRRATDGGYGNWVGDYNGAALYSRYSADGINGKGALSINLTNDVVVVPMDGNYIDSDFIDENGYPINPITTDVQLFLGDDPFDDFTINSCEFFTVDNHKLSLTNSGVLQDSIIVTANYSGGSISTSWKINKTRVAYELIPNHNVIRRIVSGENSGKLEQSELIVTIKKWDGTAWIPTNKSCGLKTNDSSIELDAVGGQVVFNLSSYKDITSLRIYLVEDESIYEDIAVIADGINGQDGINGKDGINGADGVNGENGKDGVSITWLGELASHPSNPQNGWAYYNTGQKKSFIYQDGAWYQMTIDGTDGQDGQDGKDGQDGSNGLSIVWKGDLATAPANPEVNWCYRDTDNGKVYIYNGSAWELMVLDGSDGADGADGANGLSVFITYHDNPITSTPTNPTGNGTTNGWHTTATKDANWMSQKVAATASDGTWGDPIQICGANGQDGSDGKDGNSILNITKRYTVNNDAKNPPKEGWVEDSTTLSTNYDTARYMWCWERIEYSQSEPTDSYYVVTIHGEPGIDGTGTKAPLIYPAGVWVSGKVYSSTVDKVPYVYYLDVDIDGNPTDSTGYYVLGEELGNYQSDVAPNNDPNWNKMESFEAVYSDIGLFNQALVGKWVFHGDYMFSQTGKDEFGNSMRYDQVDDPAKAIEERTFIPNICFNAISGYGDFAGFKISSSGLSAGHYEGTSLVNGLYINSQGIRHFFSDDNSSAFSLTTNGKGQLGNNLITWNTDKVNIGEISVTDEYLVSSDNNNIIRVGNGRVELFDNGKETVKICCENDGEDIPSYINIGNFNPQPARSGGHYDDLKSYISTGTTDATETFTAIKTHDGYYAGFKPTFEIKTLNSDNTSIFLTNLTQIYKIDVTEDGTYEVLVDDYLSKSDVRPEGMFHEIYLNVSSGLDVEVKFIQPFIDDVLYSVKTNSKYKSLIRCHYCFGEWHFFEIKSA